jgi:hypothetical protein
MRTALFSGTTPRVDVSAALRAARRVIHETLELAKQRRSEPFEILCAYECFIAAEHRSEARC